jgi:alanyl-tRNA synthetase
MTSNEVREKYLKFFISSPRNHREITPAPLVLEGDPTTLFTSSGMQPLIPYLKGEKHVKGKRLVDSQPSLRLQDIEEVGDNRHETFFEMLGNWSLGDYFKKEQIPWIFEFFTKELGLSKEKLWVSVFEGTKDVPKDTGTFEIWKSLGIPEERIVFYGADKNWWSRSGSPDEMPVGEIGGPDSEIFFDFGTKHDPKYGEKCHPNCDCGRFLEIGNSVFIEYEKKEDGSLKELPQKNVDFGGGLERITAAVNNNPDVFEIDSFLAAKKTLEAIRKVGPTYMEDPKPYRIIMDHLKASIFLVSEGLEPSNRKQGYILRRLLRRAMVYSRKLGMGEDEWLSNALPDLVVPYIKIYPRLDKNIAVINKAITDEVDRFRKTIGEGIKALKKIFGRAIGGVDPENLPHGMEMRGNIIRVNGEEIFRIYETYGLPPEISQEIMTGWGLAFDATTMEECDEAMKKHQELSRTASAGMFKGGLAGASHDVTKLHTATHLLHASLRKILGEGVSQKGSNITSERLRFDFSYPQKLTDEELTKVEDLVNVQIEKKLPVSFKVMSLDEAISLGALHFFAEKYGKEVKVYSIGDFSKEVCGGPHVKNTSEIGRVKIIKQEKVGAGIVRIYAKFE